MNGIQAQCGQPWWRYRMMWLVLAGPAVVVVAGLATFWIAASHPDPVVGDTARPAAAVSNSYVPAQQARNHAAAAR